jgi:hypothetical protein
VKSFIRYLLVGILSSVCGAIVTHQIIWQQIRSRVVPFDRSCYDNMCIDPAFFAPQFNFDFQGTNQVFWTSSPQRPNSIKPIYDDLEKTLRHWAGYSTNFPFIVSFNPEFSVAQVESISQLFREVGFPPIRCLIEDNWDADNNRARRFRELRIGVEGTFSWHIKEWFIDGLQKESGRHLERVDRETKR